jgi:hypothetical protein
MALFSVTSLASTISGFLRTTPKDRRQELEDIAEIYNM